MTKSPRMALAGAAALFTALTGLVGIASADTQCPLMAPKSPLKHIVFLQFDNLHLERDTPNVPSDLEQMPHLFRFLTEKGVLSANDHTVQISHTANGFLTVQAGVYSDRLGSALSNDFYRFKPDGSTTTLPQTLFVYWTDRVVPSVPVLIDERGKNAPAPWTAFTRAGCDVAFAGITGAVLAEKFEETTTELGTVFGADSGEVREARRDPAQAAADFKGLAIHCARDSTVCTKLRSVADRLPDQPGGYDGYKAVFGSKYIFGSKYVASWINSARPLKDLDGNPIQDSEGHEGFPGFDSMLPSVSLAYAAQFLEAGVPIVEVYASDAHDNHVGGGAFGPGSAGYEAQLAAYDRAFASFFDRLKEDGIDESNTLFVFTTDESDHFVGSAPNPPSCDGVQTHCTYAKIGEITADIRRLVADQHQNTTAFVVHEDSAPAVYVHGNPEQADAVTRALERDLLAVTIKNPLTGATTTLGAAAVDQAGMRFLHMTSSDPARIPTFVLYLDENFYGTASCGIPAPCSSSPPCILENPGYAYNHGDFQEDIRTTWLGIVGPGVKPLGLTDAVWSDHVDVRPTILAIAGISSDYVHDGRVLVEFLDPERLPSAVTANRDAIVRLGAAYKEVTAPFHQLGLAVLDASTRGLRGTDADYATIERRLSVLTVKRNHLAGRMRTALDTAFFQNKVNPSQLRALADEAQQFLTEAKAKLR